MKTKRKPLPLTQPAIQITPTIDFFTFSNSKQGEEENEKKISSPLGRPTGPAAWGEGNKKEKTFPSPSHSRVQQPQE